ncbi:MAG: hypothetical protein ACOCVL_01570 [Candidatus Sumerlaeota bacterium]
MTKLEIQDTQFYIDGEVTYKGREFEGRAIEGLLMNSRMIQALFDDENPETREYWKYPDTGVWDPDRNTDEFCAALPEYRRHGLLAVTVGLQGGGSIYNDAVYPNYINSAFRPDGSLKKPYFDRLLRILEAADKIGMVVIVSYFYVRQIPRIPDDDVVRDIIRQTTQWLLDTGYENILVEVANEGAEWWKRDLFHPDNLPELIAIAKSVDKDGRRLPVSVSTGGGAQIPTDPWLEVEDFTMPHGNGCMPGELADKIRRIRQRPPYQKRPRPICVNEDSIFVENMEAALREYASWGFYCQGYGSGYKDRMNWREHGREKHYADLSGYQTVPVNWSINTPIKKAFFERLKEITGGQDDVWK